MSIYTKIFATASIFAIAASALISPAVSAATGVTVTGYSNSNPSYSLCLFGPGQTSANAVVISSGSAATTINANLPVTPLPTGSTYSIYVQNASNSCTNGTLAGSVSTFVVYPNHVTNVVATGTAPTVTFAGTVINQAPYLSTNAGNTTINLCLGKTDAVTVEFTDPDGDNLQVGAAPVLPAGMTYSSNQSAGKLTYTLYPSSSNTAVLGNLSGTFTLTAQEQANSYQAAAGTSTASTVIFNVTASCTAQGSTATVSSVVASSSVTASSTAATTSTAASAMAAKSSTTATVEVETPSAGKGSATVRTGGAY